MRLVIVLLAVNIVSFNLSSVKITFFCGVYNNFCSNFFLYDVIDFLSMWKSIIDKKFSDRLSSFERSWSSLLRFLMALQRSLLRIDKAPLLQTFGSLKVSSFGYKATCLQLLRKSMSNFRLFFLLHHIKIKFSKICKEFCKENFNIKLAFNSFKVKSYFSHKNPIPNDLKSFLVYKFTCASCSSSYIDENCGHFKTRIKEHIKKDNKSHIL